MVVFRAVTHVAAKTLSKLMSNHHPEPIMNAQSWSDSTDPLAMIGYLEAAGCYLEFEPFFTNCFERIRHEILNPTVWAVVRATGVDIEEQLQVARTAINEMCERLLMMDETSENWAKLNREIIYSKSVFARDYQDFGEANRFLSGYLIEIAGDQMVESRLQADCLRDTFEFPFVPPNDEDLLPFFRKNDR